MIVQIPLAGSYSSALAIAKPATSTFPFGSNVAVCSLRRPFILPVAVHTPVAGSYSSALAKRVTSSRP